MIANNKNQTVKDLAGLISRLKKSRIVKDSAIIVLLIILTCFFAINFDLFERFTKWFQSFEHLELDEFFITILIFVISLVWFAHRRSRELKAEVTKRKQAEEKLRLASDQWMTTFNSITDPISIHDKDFKFVKVNQAFADTFGMKPEELIGKPCYEVVHERKECWPVCPHHKTLETKKSVTEEFFEPRLKVHLEVTVSPILNDQEEIVGTVHVAKNITKRKKSEKEIKETKDFLEKVIESSRDGIVTTDEKGNILSLNKAMEAMSKFKKEDLIGEHVSIFTIEDRNLRDKIIEKTGELFEKGFTFYESIFKTKDDKYIDVECNLSMIKDDKGNYIAGVTIIRDITEKKKMEQQLLQSEKLKSLGELAGGVAHDFNNVLAAILGRAQLLKMSLEPLPAKEERRKSVMEMEKGLEIIEKAAKDGAETVRRIQEFARRRDDDKHFTTIDLNEIINHALEFTRTKWKDDAESKGIKINIKKELATLPTTSGSAAEIREVIINLINNAVDAMPEGGNLKIKTFKEDQQIVIQVEDTGLGIPKTLRDKIFDPFFTTKGVQATGLGMSVSYGIINRHRGTISVDSREGQGTTFTIKLPISRKVMGEEEKVIPIAKQRKATILVIEDEEQVRNLLSSILRKGGHQVESVSEGKQGVELFKKKEFDLVFTDLGMPRMSGWQVAEKIKSINERVPIAIITGWKVELNESEMKDKWVDLVIHKPFEVNQVLRLVQEGMILRDRFKAA